MAKTSSSRKSQKSWIDENRSLIFWFFVVILILVAVALLIEILPELIILAIIGIFLYYVYKGKLRP